MWDIKKQKCLDAFLKTNSTQQLVNLGESWSDT